MASGGDGGQFILEYKLTVPVVLPLDVSDSFLKGTTLMSLGLIRAESDVIASCPATAGQGALVPTSLGFPAAKLAGYDGNGWVPALAEHISTSESKAIEHARRCKEATIACGLQSLAPALSNSANGA
uniref:Uncharacterized protein n=1 Tax=Oryza rufipogon TaxID=4529 RepID=A0A0E0NPQ9_ORYRU